MSLILGDAFEVLRKKEDEFYDLIVTSPPYWNLKDYGHSQQIGWGQEYPDYMQALCDVFREGVRTLKPGCRLAINIGDQYLSAKEHGRYRILPVPSDLISNLLYENRIDFMGQIIWRKISTTNPSGGGSWMGSTYYPRDGQITYEHEYILLFKKEGHAPRPTPENKEKSKLTKEQRSKWFRGVWDDIPPERQTGPMACFPLALPSRLIRMYSFWDDLILDPFAGMCTTLTAAENIGRRAEGIDLRDWRTECASNEWRSRTSFPSPRPL